MAHLPIWLGWNEKMIFSDLPGLILPEAGWALKWAILLNWKLTGSILQLLVTEHRVSTLSFSGQSPKLNSPMGFTERSTGSAVAISATSAWTSEYKTTELILCTQHSSNIRKKKQLLVRTIDIRFVFGGKLRYWYQWLKLKLKFDLNHAAYLQWSYPWVCDIF